MDTDKMSGIHPVSSLSLLRMAAKYVPAVKYAIGVGGVAVVAIKFHNNRIEVVAAIASTLALMMLLAIFSTAVNKAKESLHTPAIILAWSVLILFVAASTLTVSSVFFGWPKPMADFDQRTTSPGPVPIDGIVLDNVSGMAVGGVEVTLDGHRQLITDQTGRFHIDLSREKESYVALEFEKNGYRTFTQRVLPPTQVQIRLEPLLN